MATRVIELELSAGLPEPLELPGCDSAFALLRYQGQPVGALRIPFDPPRLTCAHIQAALQNEPVLRAELSRRMLDIWLSNSKPFENGAAGLAPGCPPSWSVIVCTRDRPEELRRCLESLVSSRETVLQALPEGLAGEILVVDNGSKDGEPRRVVEAFPGIHYLSQDRPGLNWARSLGARSAHGEVVLYTDDDVVADPGWILAMLEPFRSPRVAAVTGLVMPFELETQAQELFEVYGGFGRGFNRRCFDYTTLAPAAAGIVGAGASMAFRRELLVGMGLFDAELDAGTAALTGGDAYAFYRLLVEGWKIVYTPSALSWHRHRRDYADLRKTLAAYTVGGFAFLTRCFLVHKDWQAFSVALEWLKDDHLKQLGRSILGRGLPLDLVLPQLMAVPSGVWAHFRAYRRERSMAFTTAGLNTPEVNP